jgi:ATP-dependent helicase/nuclease subunit B
MDQPENYIPRPLLHDAQDAGAFLARTGDRRAAQQLQVLESFEETTGRAAYRLGSVDRATVQRLYGKKLRLSASQIDRQAECRLSYFLQYGLRAKERKEATVDPTEFGTFVHWVLEQTARQVRDMGGFRTISLEDILEISQDFARQYAHENFSQLDSQRMSYLLRRNGQELKQIVEDLWQELQQSEFQPADFEVRFDRGGTMEAVQIPNTAMEAELRGLVDRVDLWESDRKHYFRVVDYKTGRKDFDYCDVFNGVGLQMLLYMFALEQGGHSVVGENPVSAGVQYFPARAPLVSADGRLTAEEAVKQRKKLRRRKGLLLNSDPVLQAMESGEEFNLLPCTRRKDGTITGDLATSQQLRQLQKYLFKLLADMVNEIASGLIEPNPYSRGSAHDACTFCPYSPICRETSEEHRRNYKAMSSQRFWEEIGKEV